MIKIGVPKEVKIGESRVGLTPDGVRECLAHSDLEEDFASQKEEVQVFIEKGAGILSGYSDEEYRLAGAYLCDTDGVWDTDLIIKVKEPLPEEYGLIDSQVIYGFFHWNSPSNAGLRERIRETSAVCLPYEGITHIGSYYSPCLIPMSAIAGRLALQKGAQILEGSLLLGGVPGTRNAKVVIVGGGVVGYNAATMAIGMGADVTVLDIDSERLTHLDSVFRNKIKTVKSNKSNLIKELEDADLVIGAVLVPGCAAPKVITNNMICGMKPGSVIVDVAIDEGGCTELSRPTSHETPTYIANDVIFYCVPNMPALVPKISTPALTQETSYFLGHIIGSMKSYRCSYKVYDNETRKIKREIVREQFNHEHFGYKFKTQY